MDLVEQKGKASMTDNKKRIEWVDINKFILIFLVLSGHAASPYNPYIYLFHIPAFFFISGYVTNFDNYSLPKFIWHKFQSLMIPFFAINVIFLVIRFLLHPMGLEALFYNSHMTYHDFQQGFLNLFKYAFTVDIGGATWFLIVLFTLNVFGKLLYQVAGKVIFRDSLTIGICILLFIYSYSLHKHKIFYPYLLDLTLHALLYFMLGYFFNKYKIFTRHINHSYSLVISGFLIFFFGNISWIPMNWPTREFDTPYTNFLAAMAGIYLCFCLSFMFSKINFFKKIMPYIGVRTLSILLFHFVGFKLFYLLMVMTGFAPARQMQALVLPANNKIWACAATFGIIFSLGVDYIISRSYLLNYLLLGRKKQFMEKQNHA